MSRPFVFSAFVTIAALVHPTAALAGQATCSNPGLPVGATASSDLVPRRLTFSLTTSLLPVRSEQILDEPQGPVQYDARAALVETRLSAELALSSWLAVGLALPYRVVDVDVTYRDPASGQEIAPASVTIHARDETLRGFGDPSLHVHLARELRGGLRLHARVGTSVPLGGTVEDPFLLGDIGQEHQHVQLGTGTFIPFVVLEAQRPIANVTLAAWLLARASLYESDHGFRAGDRYSGGVTGSSALGTRTWTFSLAAELHEETAEEWHGVVDDDEGNAGRRDVLAGVAAAWRPLPGLAFVADVKVPVYSHVVGPQLDYAVVAGVGIAGTFDLGRPPSWQGLDQASAGPPGTAPPLAPVAGRIAVYDLWAAWCAPCGEFDRLLEALVRRYPGRVAVRKLDVVDTDSATWARYLEPGGYVLPHVKIVGEDGALLLERSAPPAELVRAVEDVLRSTMPSP